MAGTQKTILSYRVGKRDYDNAAVFLEDLRERVLGVLEISSNIPKAYAPAVERNRPAQGCGPSLLAGCGNRSRPQGDHWRIPRVGAYPRGRGCKWPISASTQIRQCRWR